MNTEQQAILEKSMEALAEAVVGAGGEVSNYAMVQLPDGRFAGTINVVLPKPADLIVATRMSP